MKPAALDVYETRAVASAAATSVDTVLEAVFEQLYEAGIRSLDDLDGDKFKAIASKLGADGTYHTALTGFLKQFGDDARHQITNTVPF